MTVMEGNDEGFLSLFSSRVKGYVMNTVTGTVMSRKDVIDLYHYLARRCISNTKDEWACEMLSHCRDLLDIPDDLHEDIINEIRRESGRSVPVSYRRPVLEEVEALMSHRKARTMLGKAERSDREGVEGIEMSNRSDILEMEQGSLLFEMERGSQDISEDTLSDEGYMIGSDASMMDDILSLYRKGPKKR
ncbi:MAG: hypothetical protein JXA22_08450 [Candidatus Thermoplasmatota archaeon]|nr:hypothetical protein [Candidatus Thermoplasmatota archaeon]